MLIEENKAVVKSPRIRKFNRISIDRIKAQPTIPGDSREDFNPNSLGPGKYDVKFELTERNPRATKF
jgi:hypothetical protein